MEEVFIDIKHGRVFGMRSGPAGGPLVLGIHGWSQRNGWHTWEPLLEPLGAAGFQAVSVDMPGWGRSPAGQSGPLQTAPAGEIVIDLIAGLGAEQAVLMGKSWGGGVALHTALAHPGRIEKLILTAPAFRDFARLPEITQPVLLAWAEDDPVIPHRYAQEYTGRLPDVDLITYPTGGHSAAPQNAADFAPKAISFLKEDSH